MKHKTIFTDALNTATAAINAASGLIQELTLPDGEVKDFRFRLAAYGEHPGTDITGKPIIQVVDRECAQILAANYGSLGNKLATFFRGVPIYEGHADDIGWSEKNPGHKASAVGRIKTIEAGDDGIYVTCALNSSGVELLGGDAPRYTGHSPYWRLAEIPGRAGCYRPVLLWSTALTNNPNIPGNSIALNSTNEVDMELLDQQLENSPTGQAGETENQEQHNEMKLTPDALKALGFAPDATPSEEEINAAIIKMASMQAEAEAKKVTAEGEATAANSNVVRLQNDLNNLQGVRTAAVETVITDAINTGRITEADKGKWTAALNTDFTGESAKLSTLMPTINTSSKVVSIERGRQPQFIDAANAAASITDGVTAFAKEQGIDISTTAGWDKAYNACRAAKPELFGKA